MRAAVLRGGEIVVRDDVPEPRPGPGQVLAAIKACGICGSDLHFARHGGTMLELNDQIGGLPSELTEPNRVDLGRDVFLGHEFAAEILEAGPEPDDAAAAPKPGTLVTSVPVLLTATGIAPMVYSNQTLCGYGERVLLSTALLAEVPAGVGARRAALTEPMAVGLHAVNRSGIEAGEGALVLGCGPIGLAVVAALKVRGTAPIVASDPSPARRALATAMGAHESVDPRAEPAFAAWARLGGGRPLVAFEAIGLPGIIDDALRWAPPRTRLVVVGVCMQADRITPFFGIAKEIDLRFSVAYDPAEFADSLRSIAEGEIDVEPMITAEVGLDGVAGAFEALDSPQRHCKILVVP